MTDPSPGANALSAATVPRFEPRIAGFFCNWCTYGAGDPAVPPPRHAPNVTTVRLMCSGRVDPQFVLDAFAQGADGVLIGGCHPGDCHYQDGNFKALRRVRMLRGVLEKLGIEEGRLRLEWFSAAEGDKLRAVVAEMVEQVRALGPLRLETQRALHSALGTQHAARST